jgi:hypothetical protein
MKIKICVAYKIMRYGRMKMGRNWLTMRSGNVSTNEANPTKIPATKKNRTPTNDPLSDSFHFIILPWIAPSKI